MLEINHNRAPAPIIAEKIETENRATRSVSIFLKAVSLFLLLQAIICWMRVIGLADSPPNRFDTMTPDWQLMLACLCVAEPVAALGLWIGHSWGVAVWVLLVMVQTYVVAVYSILFSALEFGVAINLMLLAFFVILEVSMRFIPNKRLTGKRTNP